MICDIQRGGPSTGLPTKTEQSDLLQALFGRNGEAPVPIVVAAKSPSDCFYTAIEAVRIAVTYRTPVFLLSDGYLANGSEPWQVPDGGQPAGPCEPELHPGAERPGRQLPALRCGTRRRWPGRGPIPGTPGLEHRIGGIEKADRHRFDLLRPGQPRLRMVRTRQAKVDRHRPTRCRRTGGGRPDRRRRGCWCSAGGRRTGVIGAACRRVRRRRGCSGGAGAPAAPQPVPGRTSARCCRRYDRVVVPEMNLGQLAVAAAGEIPGRRHRSTTRCAGCRSARPSWPQVPQGM